MTAAMTPDPREGNLPKWAQIQLVALRVRVQDLQRVADVVKGAHEGSNVRLVDFGNIMKPTPLPNNSHVEFDSKWGKITVHHNEKGRVRVQGDNVLILRMEAGNALTVELDG